MKSLNEYHFGGQDILGVNPMDQEIVAAVFLKNSTEQIFNDHNELNYFLCDCDKSEIEYIEWY